MKSAGATKARQSLVTWLHVSDFHFTADKRYERSAVLDALVRSIPVLRKRFGWNPDMVFVTGDITNSGVDLEFRRATRHFDALLEAAGVGRDRLFVVPGNHDIIRAAGESLTRTLSSADESDDFFSGVHTRYHLKKLAGFRKWHDDYFKSIRSSASRTFCAPPEVVDIRGIQVGLLPLNSAIFCQDDHDHGKLWVGRSQLDVAIATLEHSNPDLRIALIHHPLDWLHQQEGEHIQAKLYQHVDLILRGHLHNTTAEIGRTANGGALQIAAGASYQSREWPKRALFVQANLDKKTVRIAPIRYEDRPQPVWTLDTSVFPQTDDYLGEFPLWQRSKRSPSPRAKPKSGPADAVGPSSLEVAESVPAGRDRAPTERPRPGERGALSDGDYAPDSVVVFDKATIARAATASMAGTDCGSRYAADLDNGIETSISDFFKTAESRNAGAPGPDCLVAIHTKDATMLGKRIVLDESPMRVGRASDNHVVLEGDSISRHHAHFVHRGTSWFVVDNNSTNGVSRNEDRVSGAVMLKNGDHIRIGPNTFKFFSGATLEEQYHEQAYRLIFNDSLTQLPNKRYFMEVLTRTMNRSRRSQSDLSILFLDIDHFKRVNEVHGEPAGDFVLKEFARLAQTQISRSDTMTRYGEDEFALVLPGTSLDGAATRGQTIREHVSDHTFTVGADKFKIKISAGAAALMMSDRSPHEFIKRAMHGLYIAKREGGDQVVAAPPDAACDESITAVQRAQYRRVLEGPSLVKIMLTWVPAGALLAFEVGEEAKLVAQVGEDVYIGWFRQLLRVVETSMSNSDVLATLRQRYVVAALREGTPEGVNGFVTQVMKTWNDRPVDEDDHPAISPQIRFASLSSEEVAEHQERSLNLVIQRLGQGSVTAGNPEDSLPFLIAGPMAMISAKRTTHERIESLLHGIDMGIRLIVAIEIGALHEVADPALDREAAKLLAKGGYLNRVLLMEAWEELVWRLAALLPKNHGGTATTMVRAMLAGEPRRAALAGALKYAIQVRKAMALRAGSSEDAFGAEEPRLREVFEQLINALRPLSKRRLVSVADIEVEEEGEGKFAFKYELHLHHGAAEHFPIIRERLQTLLQKEWCYLLAEPGERASISLAPVVASRMCKICQRVEVAVADMLKLGPQGTKVQTHGVTTNHEREIHVVWNRRVEDLYGAALTAIE